MEVAKLPFPSFKNFEHLPYDLFIFLAMLFPPRIYIFPIFLTFLLRIAWAYSDTDIDYSLAVHRVLTTNDKSSDAAFLSETCYEYAHSKLPISNIKNSVVIIVARDDKPVFLINTVIISSPICNYNLPLHSSFALQN